MLSNLLAHTIGWRDKLVDSRTLNGFAIENFDGLRAMAALMVLNQHTATFPALILGPAGVWLFFTISGYLLYAALLRTGEVVPSSRSVIAYLLRRVFRIAPLFMVVVFVMSIYLKWPVGEVSTYWINEHLLLLNAEDHLWPVKLGLLFSVFLPLIVIMLAPVVSITLRSILLLSMAIFAWWVFEYRGLLIVQGSTPYFTPFLLGMALVHLQPRITPVIGRLMVIFGLLGILGFSVNAGWADAYRQWWGFNDIAAMWNYGWLVYGACALVVIGVGTARSRFWSNPWLRLCGIISYGMYLWHWLIILWLENMGITGPAFHLLALFGISGGGAAYLCTD